MQDKQFTEECFHFGRNGEQKWMKYSLLHKRTLVEVGALREKLGSGAPMIYLPEAFLGKDKLISPDFLSVNAEAMLKGQLPLWMNKNFVWTLENMWDCPFLWNEVKSKNGCTWSKKLKRWQTGIDGYQLMHYTKVQRTTNIPLILFFLQLSDKTAQDNAPQYAGDCPVGIYACPVSKAPDMTWHPRHGLNCPIEQAGEWGGMAYWNINNLLHIGTLEDLPTSGKPPRQTNPQAPITEGIARAEQGYNHRGEPRQNRLWG